MDDITTDRNNGRTADGRFGPGNPGRPRGARHRTTVMAESIMAEGAEAVVTTVIEAANQGDMQAARIVIDRLVPARKGRTIEIELPEIKTAAGVLEALGALVAHVGEGDITPEEGAAIASVLETQRKVLETADLEARIVTLEAKYRGAE